MESQEDTENPLQAGRTSSQISSDVFEQEAAQTATSSAEPKEEATEDAAPSRDDWGSLQAGKSLVQGDVDDAILVRPARAPQPLNTAIPASAPPARAPARRALRSAGAQELLLAT